MLLKQNVRKNYQNSLTARKKDKYCQGDKDWKIIFTSGEDGTIYQSSLLFQTL